jgi:hypothetical protein
MVLDKVKVKLKTAGGLSVPTWQTTKVGASPIGAAESPVVR